jgi:hypothetical protein
MAKELVKYYEWFKIPSLIINLPLAKSLILKPENFRFSRLAMSFPLKMSFRIFEKLTYQKLSKQLKKYGAFNFRSNVFKCPTNFLRDIK